MSVQDSTPFISNEHEPRLFVYCAAIGHRQIVKLAEAKQLDDGRFVCLTCSRGQMTLERGQSIAPASARANAS